MMFLIQGTIVFYVIIVAIVGVAQAGFFTDMCTSYMEWPLKLVLIALFLTFDFILVLFGILLYHVYSP